MDYLGQLIEEKCEGGPAFSDFFFADDLVFFAKTGHIYFSTIRDVLDYFCSIYGQTVSESKSRAYFFPNVDRDTRESLSDILYF